MSIIAWVCAPLALLGAGVLLILRPWVDQGERKQRQRRAAHLDGWHEACALTEDEADQFKYVARRYPSLGRGVSRGADS